MSTRRIVILTGVSASGKTSLQNELLSRGWSRPINFTTRKPRTENAFAIDNEGDYSSNEFGEYVFLGRDQFLKKYRNGDFLENTNYMGNFYAVSRYLPKGNICIVLDPVGRAQVLEYFNRIGVNVETYYLDCTVKLQEERLIGRGDSEKDVLARKRDFNWFSPTFTCNRLSGSRTPKELADILESKGAL